MKYLLILQWPASSIKDYDAMVEVESVLSEKMSEASEVDGHDAGAGEVNIFIRTRDPEKAFEEVKGILGNHVYWNDARAAYREIKKSEYTVLWPKGLTTFRVA